MTPPSSRASKDDGALFVERAREGWPTIDDALAKMEAGTYGRSERSGLPIDHRRLLVVPWARLAPTRGVMTLSGGRRRAPDPRADLDHEGRSRMSSSAARSFATSVPPGTWTCARASNSNLARHGALVRLVVSSRR